MTRRVPWTSRTQNCIVVAPGTAAVLPPLAGSQSESHVVSSQPAVAGSIVSDSTKCLPEYPSTVTSVGVVAWNPTMLVRAVTRFWTVGPIAGFAGPDAA